MKKVSKSEQDGTHGEKYADEAVHDAYAGGSSPTADEAEKRKHGGRTKRKHGGKVHQLNMMHKEHHHEHPKAEHRAKRKRGGHVHAEHAMHGEHAKHRADRKARRVGGEVGANMHPLSTANRGMEPKGHKSYEPEHD
jgi:hypothetical protein